MSIKTIKDDEGDVYTGKVEHKGSAISDFAFGMLTAGVGFAALAADEPTTVVVNGERHSGREVK